MLFPRVFYIDLDEVFSDFVSSACTAHGIRVEEVEEIRRERQTWSMQHALQVLRPHEIVTDEVFWEPIQRAGSAFWINLRPLPWAHRLYDLLQRSSVDWYVLTSPAHCEHCYFGKVRWIKQFFGPHFTKYVITQHKELLARPGTVLVDDNPHNLDKWVRNVYHSPDGTTHVRSSGAEGVLFSSSPLYSNPDNDDPLAPILSLPEFSKCRT